MGNVIVHGLFLVALVLLGWIIAVVVAVTCTRKHSGPSRFFFMLAAIVGWPMVFFPGWSDNGPSIKIALPEEGEISVESKQDFARRCAALSPVRLGKIVAGRERIGLRFLEPDTPNWASFSSVLGVGKGVCWQGTNSVSCKPARISYVEWQYPPAGRADRHYCKLTTATDECESRVFRFSSADGRVQWSGGLTGAFGLVVGDPRTVTSRIESVPLLVKNLRTDEILASMEILQQPAHQTNGSTTQEFQYTYCPARETAVSDMLALVFPE